jgi:predicted SAM-dependent methyltransferase
LIRSLLTGERDLARAMKECYRVLVPGGKFIFSEGTPPDRKTQQWYSEMFKLKEERRTMTIPRMRTMMRRVGFKDIKSTTYVMQDFSIANWVENSGMTSEQKERIMEVHRTMPEEVKKSYQVVFTDDDVLIQSHFAIVVGVK